MKLSEMITLYGYPISFYAPEFYFFQLPIDFKFENHYLNDPKIDIDVNYVLYKESFDIVIHHELFYISELSNEVLDYCVSRDWVEILEIYRKEE